MSRADRILPPRSPMSALGKLGRLVIPRLAALFDRLPDVFFSRATQLALDAVACAAALSIAYQLRFESGVPLAQRPGMWAWMFLLPLLRPGLMWALGAYNRIWRFFNLRDAVVLGFTSLPPTLLLLAMRYGLGKRIREAEIGRAHV